MKRAILFITFLVLVCSATTFAQRSSNYWGLKLSPSLELPSKFKSDGQSVKMFNPGFDAAIGGVYNLNLGSGFYLEPGVQFFEKRYTYNDLIINDKDGNEAIKDPAVYKFGLRVPVVVGLTLFRFKDNMAVTAFTGPELNYAFAGFIKAKDAGKYDFPTNPFGAHGQRRVDLSWKAGFGFVMDNMMISIETDLGLTNQMKPAAMFGGKPIKFHEKRIGIGLTYYFGH